MSITFRFPSLLLLIYFLGLSAVARGDDATLALPASDDGLPGAGPIRRADWFEKLWLERRTVWSNSVDQDQGALVFLGDSITQGWGDLLQKSFPGVKVANRGIGGDTSRGVLIRLQRDVLEVNPSGVVLLIGTNDLAEGADPQVVANNLRLILEALANKNPHLPVILCEVFPSAEKALRPAEQIKALNEAYRETVRGNPQVTLLETWILFANENGDARAEEFPDLLHPNAEGYAKWAAALRPILATLGFHETEPDTFTPEPGFESLFNGRDLTGWQFRPDARGQGTDATFDGQSSTPDGRYVARNGRLIVTTPPEGRRIQQLWTTREFPEDFVLKLEFRATPNADSGVFIRKPQLQCRDYVLAGPYKDLKGYKPQDWNELEITVSGNQARCLCNGEVLEESLSLPETGPIGLEGDRGQMEYRRIRIKTNP